MMNGWFLLDELLCFSKAMVANLQPTVYGGVQEMIEEPGKKVWLQTRLLQRASHWTGRRIAVMRAS